MKKSLFFFRFVVVIGALLFSAHLYAQNLEIHVINVGWGASVLVKGPNGTTVLMDGGDAGKGTNKVVPYLQSIGIAAGTGLDYIIAGHQHCDHVGGLDEVINAGYNIHTKNYYDGSAYASGCVTQWMNAAITTTAGAAVAMPVGTQILLGSGAKLTCVARNGNIIGGGVISVSDENDRSIAILVQYGAFDFLWASDLGGGQADNACTGRSTTQKDIETSVITAISPGGAFPLISSGGIDVLFCNHHGSESSTNANYMNMSKPAVALIATGAGQTSGWDLPRINVVDHVLRAGVACVTVPAADVYQTEEGAPTGANTSFTGFCVGDIKVTTDGTNTFTVNGDGAVTQGPNEVAAAGLPKTYNLDDDATPPVISGISAGSITTSSATITWTTNELSNSVVEYGLTTSYGSTTSNGTLVTSHSIGLSGLSASTLYHYRVKSTDWHSNTATSGDNTFTTSAPASKLIESFTDGNFTASPVWGGSTTNWQIVANSDVAAGATNSNTLRLAVGAAVSGTQYLSTQRTAVWGTSQSWSFWLGRRAQAATASNNSVVWLWANQADVTSGTVNGYRIRFGDDTGNDEVVLQSVTNNVATDILTSSGAVTNGLTDIGFMVRVTRTSGSVWTIYTSTLPTANGTGAIATDIPNSANTTVNQGSVTNSTYTSFSNGYFAFMAVHSSGVAPREGAEYDQLYFDTSSTSPLGKVVASFEPSAQQSFRLLQNAPNPFNPTTRIYFALPTTATVTLKVYNIIGVEVATLLNDETMSEGEHGVTFDAGNLPSGVYLYKLSTPGYSETKKLLLMK